MPGISESEGRAMSDGINITLTGTDELLRNLSKLDRRVRGDAAVRIVNAGAYQIMNHARFNIQHVFSERQSSQLANSISVKAEKKGNGAVAHVRPHTPYARIQEKGGTIVPVHKKRLAWKDPDTGQMIFARKVTLPPRPYLEPAAKDHTDDVVRAMTAQSEKELQV